MTENSIIQTAINHYDENQEKYNNLFKNVEFFKTTGIDKDLKKDKIKFYDSNNKLIASADYEVCAVYYKNDNFWLWAWGIISLTKNHIKTSKKLLNYGLDIDITKTHSIYSLIKYFLINSKLKVNNKLEFDIYISLSLYLSKKQFIYQAIDTNNKGFNKFYI